jgi:hypothetical protein
MIIRISHVSGEAWLAKLEILNQDPGDYESVKAAFETTDEAVVKLGLDLEPALGGSMIWFDRILP